MNTTKLANSSSSSLPLLLLLPAEIRLIIWEYIFNAPSLSTPRIRESAPRFYTTGAQPTHYFALMQSCHSIYAETTLLPLKLVEFYFTSKTCFDWVRKLPLVRRGAISKVRFVTWGLPFHGEEEGQEFRPLKFALETFPAELFPGLRRLVVEVRLPVEYQALRNHGRIREVQGEIVRSVRKGSELAEVEFEWVGVGF